MRDIDTIVVHCTATPAGRPVTVQDVTRWHKARGWRTIGYHWLVGLEGERWMGRPESEIGAHVRGHNTGSIGVCYVGGGKPGAWRDTRTAAQEEAFVEVIEDLMGRHPIRYIVGHNDFDPHKACPCFDARAEYAHLLNAEAPGVVPEPSDILVGRGDFGEAVYEWQRLLRDYGYGWIAIDGIFGPETERLTRAWQTSRGIVVDGIVGPQSRGEMDAALEALSLV